ncbi:hypothetical protein ACFVTF_08735 [Kitasatospora sp. NPDC057940]|uniref:hypothetical protein n=1 Tax=Kitasatospora sp. NPDC057940 TaxID=3346285 RepID=UPI0036D7AE38
MRKVQLDSPARRMETFGFDRTATDTRLQGEPERAGAHLFKPLRQVIESINQTTISRASHLATVRCMKDFGLQTPEETDDAFAQAATAAKERTQLYGYFAPAKAAEKGYDRNQVIPDSDLSRDVTSVLYGSDSSGKPGTSFNGKPVPKGGCWQAGADALGGAPPVPGGAQGLPDKGPRIPLTDPRLTTAYAEWSACMKTKGYSHAGPADAYSDRKWGMGGHHPTGWDAAPAHP